MRPGQHRQHIEDRATAVGFDDRNERAGHVQCAEVVGFHFQSNVFDVTRQQLRAGGDPCVVHEHVDVGCDFSGPV